MGKPHLLLLFSCCCIIVVIIHYLISVLGQEAEDPERGPSSGLVVVAGSWCSPHVYPQHGFCHPQRTHVGIALGELQQRVVV